MSSWKIFSYPQNPRVFKSLVAAKYNGIEIEVPSFNFPADTKTPEFLKLNPWGKVPTLSTPEGAVFESNAIARHVARSGKKILYGKNDIEAANVDAWLDFASTTLEPVAMAILGPIYGFMPYNKKSEQEARDKLNANFKVLDAFLASRTFFVGERLSLADIVLFFSFHGIFTMYCDAKFREPYRNLVRWFNTCAAQANFVAVVGETKLCEKALEPKKQEAAAAAAPKKEEAKPAPKKEAAPKKEEPAHAEEEEETFDEPKKKNPLDELPKSSFVMDAFKRTYSNEADTRGKAMPQFWTEFDPAGFSIWWCTYKYNDELAAKADFAIANLVGGWFQRCDHLHKYALSSVHCVAGEDGKKELVGVWVVRGGDIRVAMHEVDDLDLYEWKQMDVTNAAEKERFNDFFVWDRDLDGKKILVSKLFK